MHIQPLEDLSSLSMIARRVADKKNEEKKTTMTCNGSQSRALFLCISIGGMLHLLDVSSIILSLNDYYYYLQQNCYRTNKYLVRVVMTHDMWLLGLNLIHAFSMRRPTSCSYFFFLQFFVPPHSSYFTHFFFVRCWCWIGLKCYCSLLLH